MVAPRSSPVVVDVAVGDEAVGPAVVVEVGQGAAPADPGHGVGGQADCGRRLAEDGGGTVAGHDRRRADRFW